MTFSTDKEKQSSQKFLLVRLGPARFINDVLSNTAGNEYEAVFTLTVFDPFKLELNGVELTKVSGTPSADEWSYNEATKTVTLNSATAPSSTAAFVVYYYLYYTVEKFRTIGQDPETPGSLLRDWEPRLLSSPSVNQNIKNILQGTLSISPSSVSLINDNEDFDQYLSDDDSFYNKEVKMWHVLDEVTSIQKVFEGTITNITSSRRRISIGVTDNLKKLQNPALMGDDEAYFTDGNFTAVQPRYLNAPVKFYFGTVSRYELIPETVTNLADAQQVSQTSLEVLVCTDFTNDLHTSNNREYHAGRVTSNGPQDFTFSPSAVDNTDPNFTRLDTTGAVVATIFIGDTFEITGSGTYRVRVLYVDRTNDYVYVTKDAGIIATDTVNNNDCPTVTVFDGSFTYLLLYGRDYTASTVATTGGNELVKVDLVANFEANHAGLLILDPEFMDVRFRIHPPFDDQTHGDVLSTLLTFANQTVNAASITTANSTFNVNANFSIPNFDEGDYAKYTKYIQDILSSTFGYILLNNSFEIEYKLFSAPSGSTEVTDTEVMEGSYNYRIDYNDIVTQIIGFNPHFNNGEFNSVSSATSESNKSKHLHGVDTTTRFRHVLEDFTSKVTDLINYRSERSATYSFRTKGQQFDSEVGDDFLLKKGNIPGQATSRNIKLLGLEKSAFETKVTATDLLNI